jgi:hypothetical protein
MPTSCAPPLPKALHMYTRAPPPPLCMGTNARPAAQIRGTRPFSKPSFAQSLAVLRGLQTRARVCAADGTSMTEGNCCANLLRAHP